MSGLQTIVTYHQINRVLSKNYEAVTASMGHEARGVMADPVEAASMLTMLAIALKELEAAEKVPGVLATPENQAAALLQSFLAERATEMAKLEPLPSGGLEAKFDDRDWLAWAGSFFTWWKGIIPHRWLSAPPQPEVLANTVRLASLGDWGTGMYGAPVSARSLETDPKGYGLLMHLGDVYYSGTDDEVKKRFLEIWPLSRWQKVF